MIALVALLALLTLAAPYAPLAPYAPDALSSSSAGSCVVVQELTADTPLLSRGDCTTRHSPASTFKIPHALVALETGAATVSGIEKWDGTKYARQVKWNQDHTVISALKPSVLWLFQRVAPRIGATKMTTWLTTFAYGNADVSGPITEYWVNGRLKISPAEQVAFLRKFYGRSLPIKDEFVDAVMTGLEQTPGTVENALGVHRLDGNWAGARLNSKTGATTAEGERVSWLVGRLQVKGRDYVFASALWHAEGNNDTLAAARLAATTFVDAGLLSRRR